MKLISNISKFTRMKTKNFKMPKYYFNFKPDYVIITRDDSDNVNTESILYRSVKCISMLGAASFYFKSSKNFYVLFFKNFLPENAIIWYKVLMMNKDKHSENQNEVYKIDIGESFGSLKWDYKNVIYNFNYKTEIGEKKDLTCGFNADIPEIWISDVENHTKLK